MATGTRQDVSDQHRKIYAELCRLIFEGTTLVLPIAYGQIDEIECRGGDSVSEDTATGDGNDGNALSLDYMAFAKQLRRVGAFRQALSDWGHKMLASRMPILRVEIHTILQILGGQAARTELDDLYQTCLQPMDDKQMTYYIEAVRLWNAREAKAEEGDEVAELDDVLKAYCMLDCEDSHSSVEPADTTDLDTHPDTSTQSTASSNAHPPQWIDVPTGHQETGNATENIEKAWMDVTGKRIELEVEKQFEAAAAESQKWGEDVSRAEEKAKQQVESRVRKVEHSLALSTLSKRDETSKNSFLHLDRKERVAAAEIDVKEQRIRLEVDRLAGRTEYKAADSLRLGNMRKHVQHLERDTTSILSQGTLLKDQMDRRDFQKWNEMEKNEDFRRSAIKESMDKTMERVAGMERQFWENITTRTDCIWDAMSRQLRDMEKDFDESYKRLDNVATELGERLALIDRQLGAGSVAESYSSRDALTESALSSRVTARDQEMQSDTTSWNSLGNSRPDK